MKSIIPLAMLADGEEGRIVSIMGGHGLVRRLAELGFNPGASVKVIRNSGGPLVVSLRESRMAIGRGMAMRILVEVER